MEDESVIRSEASEFFRFDREISSTTLASEKMRRIKFRLYDFYTSENKAIFLDEINSIINSDLEKHRIRSHGGKKGENCDEEKDAESLLFYIKQELETLPTIVHQKAESNPQQNRDKVFVSYCHTDEDYLTDMRRHFKPFLKNINFWDDSKIEVGKKWKEEIFKAISETKVAILLVSTDFLGSEFILTEEIPPLLKSAEENGATILIVILKPCLFEEFPDLNEYQAMNAPNRPVSKMDDNEKEELYINLVRQTKNLLEK